MADHVWSEKDLIRRANRRLAVLQHAEEVSGNVAATCRCDGISRNLFYRWKRRHEDDGLDGLEDRSSATVVLPEGHSSRRGREDDPPAPALPLRADEDQDLPAALPRRRHQCLRLWRILKRLGMNRLPASQRYKRHTGRWKRYEKQRPGHYLQIDIKFI